MSTIRLEPISIYEIEINQKARTSQESQVDEVLETRVKPLGLEDERIVILDSPVGNPRAYAVIAGGRYIDARYTVARSEQFKGEGFPEDWITKCQRSANEQHTTLQIASLEALADSREDHDLDFPNARMKNHYGDENRDLIVRHLQNQVQCVELIEALAKPDQISFYEGLGFKNTRREHDGLTYMTWVRD